MSMNFCLFFMEIKEIIMNHMMALLPLILWQFICELFQGLFLGKIQKRQSVTEHPQNHTIFAPSLIII